MSEPIYQRAQCPDCKQFRNVVVIIWLGERPPKTKIALCPTCDLKRRRSAFAKGLEDE